MVWLFDSYTDVGSRDNNEDAYCALTRDDACLFAVADGLGGCKCGEVASALAVQTLKAHFLESPLTLDMGQAFAAANAAILAQQTETGIVMKTTLTAVYCTPEKTVVANVGDSRSYLIRNDRIVFQTVDHSVAQMAVLAGEITADELRQYPKLNLLMRALGRETVKADVTELPADVCDRILVCSDGFWEYVYENELVQPAASPAAWLTALRTVHAQRIPSRNDNHTAVAAMRRREKE